MPKILVTGGCGFIGSHTIVDLQQNGYEVICIDNNARSKADILKNVTSITGQKVEHHAIDLCDYQATRQVFETHPDILGIIHFAAYKAVGESVNFPLKYHYNNLNSLMSLLASAKDFKVNNFIFSSSCSVYGNVKQLPVTESTPLGIAESPYARTKQICEQILQDFTRAYSHFNAVLLRYFNPAGAHISNQLGEVSWDKPQNLVPVITETALGKRKQLTVFGADYDTRDGSCIRDYIHIMDLADAHTKSLQYLERQDNQSNCEIFNLGIGKGVTVLEAINAFEKANNKKLNYTIGARRPGDVVSVYADNSKAAQYLGWQPKYNIEDIMRTAWAWDKKRYGYQG